MNETSDLIMRSAYDLLGSVSKDEGASTTNNKMNYEVIVLYDRYNLPFMKISFFFFLKDIS